MDFTTRKCDRAIRSYIEQLKVPSTSDLEAVSQPGDGVFAKLFADTPVRIKVRIEGTFDRSTMKSPLSGRDCVMYSAAAVPSGELSPSAFSSKRSDFIASMVDAPWIKILVEGADILCFGMKPGLWQNYHKYLEKAPDSLKEFITSHGTNSTQTDGQAPQTGRQSVDFEEIALVVGSSITLVGKLCRGPGGQLSLQRWQGEASVLPESSPKESCLTSIEDNYNDAPSKDPWTGRILACDDPAYLA